MRARSLWLPLLFAVPAVLALWVTGIVDLGALGTGGRRAGTDPARPDEAGADARERAGLAGAPNAAKKKDGAKDEWKEAAEPAIPSEVSGTAPLGAVLRGRVVRSEAKIPVEGAIVRLTRPDSIFHYLRAKREGRYDELTARTDAQGRYVFRNVVPADGYALMARRGNGPAATRMQITVAARQLREMEDLVLGPSGGLGGRVADGEGKAIAGVRVAVTWEVKNEFRVVLADPDTLPWTEAETKTDAEGRWIVKGLEPGDKTIVFRAPSGAADVKTPITVTAAEQRDDVDLTLSGNLSLSGKVIWSDGSPIPAARVMAGVVGKPAGHTVDTGADGTFRIGGLAPGPYSIGVIVPGLDPLYDVNEHHDAGEGDITFQFEAAGSLVGRVIAKSTGKPVTRFQIGTVASSGGDRWSQWIARRISKVVGPRAFESPDGQFRFERLAAGTYALDVEADGFPSARLPAVVIETGHETSGLVVEMADGNRIRGTVVDERGAPVAGARLYVIDQARLDRFDEDDLEDEIPGGGADAVSEDDGVYETVPLSSGEYALLAAAEGHVPVVLKGMDLTKGSRGDVRVVIPSGGSIHLRVSDSKGRPANGIDVVALAAAGRSVSGSTETDGTWTSPPLLPGRWVIAWKSTRLEGALQGLPSDTAEAYELARKADGIEVDVAASRAAEAALRLPRLVRVTGRMRVHGEAPKDRAFYLTGPVGEGWRPVRTDAEGRFTLERQEPGTFEAMMFLWDGAATQQLSSRVVIPDVEEYALEIDF